MDREIVYEAISRNAHSLEYASDDLKNEKELVLLAVKKDGTSLKNAPMKFRADKQVVMEAVKQTANAFRYASDELRHEKEFEQFLKH